ncbi:hypothetical protein WG66_005030 [Moniliophthora roreri]|nr:hypothetical protein WG66_005030 [Moniliophthora roreri]
MSCKARVSAEYFLPLFLFGMEHQQHDSPATAQLGPTSDFRHGSFPPKILSLILIYTVRRNIFDLHTCESSFSEASSVSRVSKHWRDVSLATPEIWAIISIRSKNAEHLPKGLKHLQLHINRSKDAQLSVDVEADDVTSDHFFMAPFQKVLARLGSLQLRAGQRNVDVNRAVQKHLSVVPNLGLDTPDLCMKVRRNDRKQITSVTFLPSLFYIRPSQLTEYSLLSSRSHLTHLHVRCTWKTALILLGDCPCIFLVHFLIPPYGSKEALPCTNLDRIAVSHTTVSSLQHLIVQVPDAFRPGHDYPFSSLTAFLNALSTPSLTNFSLLSDANQNPHSIYPPSNTDFLEALPSFLYRSSPKIQKARIEGVPISGFEIVVVLKAMRWLKDLTLGEAKGRSNKLVTTALLNLLASRALPYNALAPELTNLNLEVNDDGWDSEVLEDMLEVRFRRGLKSSIVRITPQGERWKLKLGMERLRVLQREGFAVRLVKRDLDSGKESILMGYTVD